MKQILLSILLSLSAMAGEVCTVEAGTPVYDTAPVLSLAKSGLSKLQQAGKIAAWVEEVSESIAAYGESVPAAVILALIEREIERLAK